MGSDSCQTHVCIDFTHFYMQCLSRLLDVARMHKVYNADILCMPDNQQQLQTCADCSGSDCLVMPFGCQTNNYPGRLAVASFQVVVVAEHRTLEFPVFQHDLHELGVAYN